MNKIIVLAIISLNISSAKAEEYDLPFKIKPAPVATEATKPASVATGGITEAQFAAVAQDAIRERKARLEQAAQLEALKAELAAVRTELSSAKAQKSTPVPVAAAPAPSPPADFIAAMEKRLDEREAKLLAALRAAVPPPAPPPQGGGSVPAPRMILSVGGVPLCDQSGLKMPGGIVNETQGYMDGPAPWHMMGMPTGGLEYRVDSNMVYALSITVNGRFQHQFTGGAPVMTPVVHNGNICVMPLIPPGVHSSRFVLDSPGPQHFEFTAWACVGNRPCHKVGTYVRDRRVPDGFPTVTALAEYRFGL